MKLLNTLFIPAMSGLLLISGCADGKWNVDVSAYPKAFVEDYKSKIDETANKLLTSPDDFKLNFEQAFNYQAVGEFKSAVKYYKKALSLDADDFATLNNLADIHERVGDYKNAEKYITTLYNFNPNNSEVVQDAVRIFLLQNDPSRAQFILEEYAKNQSPDSQDMGLFISDLFQQIQDYHATKAK